MHEYRVLFSLIDTEHETEIRTGFPLFFFFLSRFADIFRRAEIELDSAF